MIDDSARHESGHCVALYLLGLAEVMRPGGAGVRQHGGGLLTVNSKTSSRPEIADRVETSNLQDEQPSVFVIRLAHERPDMVPALICFMLSGHGATADHWRGDLEMIIQVRMSNDAGTVKAILLHLIGSDCRTAEDLASEQCRDALDRAVEWAGLPQVRPLIDAGEAFLREHRIATWAELETIFSATESGAALDRTAKDSGASGNVPLAGDLPETEPGTARSIPSKLLRQKPTQ